MQRRQVLQGVGSLTAIGLAGCSGGGSSTPTAESKATLTLQEEGGFEPKTVEVEPGGVVTFKNESGSPANFRDDQFTDNAEQWALNEFISSGEEVTHTFEEEGIYHFIDTRLRKTVACGAVLVGGASLEESLPCQD